jgi:hypothetical protein
MALSYGAQGAQQLKTAISGPAENLYQQTTCGPADEPDPYAFTWCAAVSSSGPFRLRHKGGTQLSTRSFSRLVRSYFKGGGSYTPI